MNLLEIIWTYERKKQVVDTSKESQFTNTHNY